MRYFEIKGKSKKDDTLSENASSGATGAGSVAAVAGTLGAGFTNDLSASVYRRSELTKSKKKHKVKK